MRGIERGNQWEDGGEMGAELLLHTHTHTLPLSKMGPIIQL